MNREFELYLGTYDMLYTVAKELNEAIEKLDMPRVLMLRNTLEGVLKMCNWSRLQPPMPSLEMKAGIKPQKRDYLEIGRTK